MEYRTIPRGDAISKALAESISGWLCLSFADTVENYRLENPLDALPDYQSVVDWSVEAGAITAEDARSLKGDARSDRKAADLAYQKARSLRLAIYHIFSAIAQELPVPPTDLDYLNRLVAKGMSRLRMETLESGVGWRWKYSERSLESPLWPVAQSAAELLMSPQLDRVRQCHGQKCTWLFLDRSKNRSRRWCDMEVCGNRAKSKRHYARSRSRG